MSFEFVLQHENGTPQASRDPRILDVQLKYRFASQSVKNIAVLVLGTHPNGFQSTGRCVDAAAFPVRLNVVDEILLVRVFPVVQNEVPQAMRSLILDPSFVFKDEGQNTQANL